MSSHTIPVPNTTAPGTLRPPTTLDESAESQNPNQGEGPVIPEHATYAGDLTDAAQALNLEPGIKEKVLKSILIARNKVEGVVQPKQLSKGKKQSNGNVDARNILRGKRITQSTSGNSTSAKKSKQNCKAVKFRFQVGDGVSVRAEEFDGNKPGSYSRSNPGRHLGVVTKVWPVEKVAEVEYLDGTRFKHAVSKLNLERPKTTALLIL